MEFRNKRGKIPPETPEAGKARDRITAEACVSRVFEQALTGNATRIS
jgi:hypothetical protein